MTDIAYSPDRDLREAKAMVEGLVPYVYEEPLYGATRGGMFGSGNMPPLTIGAMLMRLRRLHTLESRLTADQRKQIEDIERQHEAARKEWREHYVTKLNRESASRLKAMNNFFDECAEDPRQCANIYLPEALRRTIVQEISRALTELNAPDETLPREMHKVDIKLHRFTQPADFIWATDLQAVYPQAEFWWLYAKPPRS